jgi:hypothetical protein
MQGRLSYSWLFVLTGYILLSCEAGVAERPFRLCCLHLRGRNFWLFWRLMHQTPSKEWYPYTSLHGVLFLKTGSVVSSAFGTSMTSNSYLYNTHVYLTLKEHFSFVRTETLRENSWYLACTPLVVTFVLYCSEVLFINNQACSVPIRVLSLGSTNKNVRRRLTGIIET